jgi:hypothetical protein
MYASVKLQLNRVQNPNTKAYNVCTTKSICKLITSQAHFEAKVDLFLSYLLVKKKDVFCIHSNCAHSTCTQPEPHTCTPLLYAVMNLTKLGWLESSILQPFLALASCPPPPAKIRLHYPTASPPRIPATPVFSYKLLQPATCAKARKGHPSDWRKISRRLAHDVEALALMTYVSRDEAPESSG